jgi:hypothetical protein
MKVFQMRLDWERASSGGGQATLEVAHAEISFPLRDENLGQSNKK